MAKHIHIGMITIFLIFSTISCMRLHMQKTSTVTYDSLKSKIATPIDYKYYDNLNSPSTNYYFGTITKQAYEMAVKLYKLDDYQQCSGMTPYATKDMQSCMTCPKERPLFNLGTRECEQCRTHLTVKCDALFNIATPAAASGITSGSGTSSVGSSTTGFSTTTTTSATATTTKVDTTSPGTVLNTSAVTKTTTTTPSTTSNTASTTSTTTSSSTSSTSDSSFIVEWKPKPKVEQKPTQVPVPTTDANINVFEPVPVTQADTALHQNYTVEYRVVSGETSPTKNNQSNGALIAQSKGQNITFSNQQCPALTPFYNPSTKTCQNCKQNEQYIPIQKKCLPIIWVSSPKTKYVILKEPDQLLMANLNIGKSNPERTVRPCPIDKPLAVNNSCMACQGDKIFNFTSQECQAGCPDGFKFSEENSKCITATFLTNSQAPNILSPMRDFQDFRNEQKKRVKSSSTIVECPLQKPFFIKGICSNCPDGLPYFNIESQQCQACTRNREYNTFTRKCESQLSSGLEIKRIVPNIF